MEEITNREEMEKIIKSESFVLFYLSRPSCGVCKALKPKIEAIAGKYNRLKSVYFNLDNDETAAGQFSIYTIPAILVFVYGKETIREARYISVDEIDEKLSRIDKQLNRPDSSGSD